MTYSNCKALSLKSNTWVYGDLCTCGVKESYYNCIKMFNSFYPLNIKINPKTICENTDFKDAFGNNMYTNDLFLLFSENIEDYNINGNPFVLKRIFINFKIITVFESVVGDNKIILEVDKLKSFVFFNIGNIFTKPINTY